METIRLPDNGTILLDTNFFIDLFEHEAQYSQFFSVQNEKNIALVSTVLVQGEFVRTKDKSKFIDKNKLFLKIVSAILPIDLQVSELISSMIGEYSQDIEGVSIVDIVLACFLKRYKGLYLLTRNHKDFPVRIFDRSCIFSVEHSRDVKTYALYQYKPTSETVTTEEIPF